MTHGGTPGWVVLLNGPPRSGKSSIAAVMQETFDGPWMNLGVAAHTRHGLNVVVDVGHHDAYSVRLNVLSDAARRLCGPPALLVGVRCPLEAIMRRRDAGQPGREGRYAASGPCSEIPGPVRRWQRHVHQPGIYDLEIDTSSLSPEAAAALVRERLAGPPPSAFRRLAQK